MATICETFQKADGSAFTETLKIASRLTPMATGGILVVSSEVSVTPSATGYVQLTLPAGYYYLYSDSIRPIDFRVPDSALTYTLTQLITAGATIQPFVSTPSAVVQFSFANGNLLLLNTSTASTFYGLQLGSAPGYAFQTVSSPGDNSANPKARIGTNGVLQLCDPSGVWHSIYATGAATSPSLAVDGASAPAAWAARLTSTQLQVPNTTAGGYHPIYFATTTGGVTLTFGPNVA